MSGISSTSSTHATTWHESAFLQIEEEYKKVDQYFSLNGSYDYENDWTVGTAMCQQAIDKCEKIIQEVSQRLSKPSIDEISSKKLNKLNDQVNTFLNHFKNEKDCAETSSWAIPSYYYSNFALAPTALHSIYSLISAQSPFRAFVNNVTAINTPLAGVSTKVAFVALVFFFLVDSYNTKRLEKRNNEKNIVNNLIKDNRILVGSERSHTNVQAFSKFNLYV